MGNKTFGELFMASRGKPIPYGDLTVHGMHKIELASPALIEVRFVHANPAVRQALRMASDDSKMLVEGQRLSDVVLWADTAPPCVPVTVTPKKAACTVKLWNAWMRDGCMDAWIGNGGMLVEPTRDGCRLRCSDGVGDPDFDDLVLELVITTNAS